MILFFLIYKFIFLESDAYEQINAQNNTLKFIKNKIHPNVNTLLNTTNNYTFFLFYFKNLLFNSIYHTIVRLKTNKNGVNFTKTNPNR